MSNHTLYLLAVQVIEAAELTPGATYAEAFLAVAAYIEQHQKDVATLIVAMLEEVWTMSSKMDNTISYIAVEFLSGWLAAGLDKTEILELLKTSNIDQDIIAEIRKYLKGE